jgi:ACS family hexuronate transporter-like MFS transporter
LVSTFGQFIVARAALGATESIGTPASIKTLSSLFPPAQRSTAIGVSNAAGTVGAMLTPVLIPGIAAAIGWRGAFMVLGGIGVLWIVPWVLAVRGIAAEPVGSTAAPGYFAMARDRRTWAIAGAKALSDQVWWLLLFWTPDFLHRNFHLTPIQMGAPLAVIYLGSALGSGFWGWLASRLLSRGLSVNQVRKGVLLACALIALPIPLAAHTGNYWIAVGLLSLTLSAHQGFSVNLFAVIGDIIPAGRVGSVTSIGAFCGNMAGALVVFIAGETLSRGGDYGPLLAFAGMSYLLGLGWLQLLLPRLSPIAISPRGD